MAEHEHAWENAGLVRENCEQRSPCSRLDDTLYVKVSMVRSCACGAVDKKHVANEDVRRRGDRRA